MADNYQIELTLDEIFGTGISSIEQTTVSTMPGGENIWTVTLTNGNAYNFTVLNGTAGGDPIPVKTASAMTDTSAVYLYLGTETGYTFGHWYYYDATWKDGGAYAAKGDTGEDGEDGADGFSPIATVTKTGNTATISITDKNGTTTAQVEDGVAPQEMIAEEVADWLDENITVTEGVTIDTSLAVAGAAADAKKTGDEISDLKSQITNGIPYSVKLALDNILQNVAFKNDDGYSADLATVHAWATDVNVTSISAVYTQSGTVYDTDSLDDLRSDLVVTASYDNGTTAEVSGYTLSGNLNSTTSPITVSYDGKNTTFNVNVTVTLKASWDYTLGRLPSSDDGITATNTGSNTATFESDGIHVVGGSTNNDYYSYEPTDYNTGTNVISECVFVITNTGNANAAFNLQTSNGTDGCNVIFTNSSDLCYYKGSTRTKITSFAKNTEYKLRIEYESGVNAKVYLNDDLILTQSNSNRSTYYTTKNRIRVINNASVTIKSMKWYVRS